MTVTIEQFGRLMMAKRGSRGVRATSMEAGVSTATYSRVENGHMPDLKTFAKLCKWLGQDPRTFLGIESGGDDTPKAVVHFKKKKTVPEETARALGDLILAAQRAIRAREELLGR